MMPALLEESAPTSAPRRVFGRLGAAAAIASLAVGLAACGGGERQDESEPEGEFPVEIASADFPASQRLAQTSDLTLTIRNAGEETIPDLAVTVFTQADEAVDIAPADAGASESDDDATGSDGEAIPESQLDEEVDQALEAELEEAAEDEQAESSGADDAEAGESGASSGPSSEANGAFSVISEQKGLAIPSRPVWILEQGYPRDDLAEPSTPPPGEIAGGSGSEAAQTNTFSFGPLEPGDQRTLVWRVTPVQSGEYSVFYRVAAGLQGNAVAVNEDGSVPEGEFVVVIDNEPPQTRVDDSGRVVPIEPDDIIGQAGSAEQQGELSP